MREWEEPSSVRSASQVRAVPSHASWSFRVKCKMSFEVGKGQTEGLFIQSNYLQIKAKEVSPGETGERKEENRGETV